MVPAIYDNGTHYVTNHKLTLEILKEISDSDDVLEVAGDYTGNITARGSSHVHSDCPLRPVKSRSASRNSYYKDISLRRRLRP